MLKKLSFSSKMILIIALILYLNPVLVIAQINFTEHLIADSLWYAFRVNVADLDDDGDMDVIGGSFEIVDTLHDGVIAWYENNGDQVFSEHVLAEDFFGTFCIGVSDLNGDERTDIVGACYDGDRITWWENAGEHVFFEHDVVTDYYNASSVYPVDLDSDDDIDLITGASGIDMISWWENDGNTNFTEHIISESFNDPAGVCAADLDGDEDIDVIAAGFEERAFCWWENVGLDSFAQHELFSGSTIRPLRVITADFDGDHDQDILGSYTFWLGGAIVWWENLGNQQFEMRVITTDIFAPYRFDYADVDLDGDLDIFALDQFYNDIFWLENTGGGFFSTHLIYDNYVSPSDVRTVDMDQDGDFDFVASNEYLRSIFWYENDLISSATDRISPTPPEVILCCNYPNPFNAETTIELTLPHGITSVDLFYYNTLGRLVKRETLPVPSTQLHHRFRANDLSTGIYFLRIETSNYSATRKLILLK